MLAPGLIGTRAVPENVLNLSIPTDYSPRITKANPIDCIYPFLTEEGLNMYLPIVLVISVSTESKFDYKSRSKGWACDQQSCKNSKFHKISQF